MALSRRELAGRIVYGTLFVAVLPAGLVAWANATESVVGLPVFRSQWASLLLVLAGILLMFTAIFSLWRDGGGLPMNAYPPPRLVDRGVYGLLPHPIYVGFVLLCAGVSLGMGSASGLWFVTPLVALGATALVVGYEGPELRERFGDRIRRSLFSLPGNTGAPPTRWERASVYLLVFLPWTLAYEAVQFMGVPPDAISSHLPIELSWPVFERSAAVYSSVYVLVLMVPLIAETSRGLWRFAMSGLWATVVVTLMYLTLPFIAPPRPFEPTTFWGHLLALEQGFNHTVASFPAFHVLWACFAAAAWPRRFRVPAALWAGGIVVSCITTGMHSLADLGVALLLVPVFLKFDSVWNGLRMGAEYLANSWKEWRWGPVRVLNHGFFGALSMAMGVLVVGVLVGPGFHPWGALVAMSGLVGAAAWAQRLEGSSVLLRPFGFYGSLIGVFAGVSLSQVLGGNGWVLLGGFAVAAPWVQAIGRFRCLIQGCCHGGPAPPQMGIRYFHTRSRVTRLTDLGGVPIYPTPLFSILGNLFIGVSLLRLWSLGVPPTFVAGTYLVLSGLARFVEESFRAEPQTKLMAGLHVYHWMAIGSVIVGAVLTGVGAVPPDHWIHVPTRGTLLLSLGMGVVAGVAMGVDFPASDRRFSRLADVKGRPRLLGPEEARSPGKIGNGQ